MHPHSLDWLLFKVAQRAQKAICVTFGDLGFFLQERGLAQTVGKNPLFCCLQNGFKIGELCVSYFTLQEEH